MSKIIFSVICASKNEENHIEDLINSFNEANNDNAELIIIDDSNDNTKSIVLKKSNQNIKLINGDNNGCCNARNKGVKNAAGDIITYMTADSVFPANFFLDLKNYFDQGYDIVMTSSKVMNAENIWSRFIDAWSNNKININKNFSPLTSQGYSVKKTSALSAGLIDPGSAKPNICRDYTLVRKMEKLKYSKIFAKDIICYHKAPDTFSEFVLNQYTRGIISGGTSVRYDQRGFIINYMRSFTKLFLLVVNITIPLSPFQRAIRMAKFSKFSDLVPFFLIIYLKNMCFIFGEIITICRFNVGYYKK